MNWYYLNGEKRSGPFSASTLREMRACGILADETMVSKEGKDQWQPYVKAFPPEAHQQDSAAPPIPSVLKFECPHCQQHISADSSQAGISAQCPACAGEFVVPKASQEFDPTNSGGESNEEERSTSSLESQRDDAASRVHHCGPVDSIGERVKNSSVAMKKGARIVKEGAQIGWAGLKRRSKQAALKAQIEKLRNIDLRKAYHALGRSAFEKCILADEISDHFQTVHDLDAKIAALREKGTAEEGETKMAALKRMGKDTAKAGQAQALTVKREHLITELGRAIYDKKLFVGSLNLNDEIKLIDLIEQRINEVEHAICELDDGDKSTMQVLAFTLAIGVLAVGGMAIGLSHFNSGKRSPQWETSKGTTEKLILDKSKSIEMTPKGMHNGETRAANNASRTPWQLPPYSLSKTDKRQSIAEQWFSEDTSDYESPFKDFRFGMSLNEFEKNYVKDGEGFNKDTKSDSAKREFVLWSQRSHTGQKKVSKTFSFINGKLVGYRFAIGESIGDGSPRSISRDPASIQRAKDLRKQYSKELAERIGGAANGPLFSQSFDGMPYEFSEISFRDSLGTLESHVVSGLGVIDVGASLNLVSRDYVRDEFIPMLDWYVDEVAIAFEKGYNEKIRWDEESFAPPSEFDDELGGYIDHGVLQRALISCLLKKIGYNPKDLNRKASKSVMYWIHSNFKTKNGTVVDVDRYEVRFTKPVTW